MKQIKISNGEVRIGFEFNDLDSNVQDKVLNEFSNTSLDYEWYEHIFEDASSVGIKIKEFDCDRGTIKGELDSSTEEVIESIINEHGKDCETHKTALKHLEEFKSKREESDAKWEQEYPQDVRDECDERGDYYPDKDEYFDDNYREDLEDDFKQEILEDYLILLRKEAEYLSSTEQAKETIEANEYLFTEEGDILPISYHVYKGVVKSHSFRIGKNEYNCTLEDIGSKETSAVADKILTDEYGEPEGLNADWSILVWPVKVGIEEGLFICDDDTYKDNYDVTVRSYREEHYNTDDEFKILFSGTAKQCIDYVNSNNLK